ncbi:MAG: helix-turn-helix domain-containing protein [Candidatus Thorarchaeota archaeon]
MSFIERLQLTPEEKQIYQLLLGSGQLTAFEVAQFSNLHYSNVKTALDSLVSKGAVGSSEGYISKYYVKIPLGYLATTSDKLNENINQNISETKSFIENKKNTFENLRGTLSSQLSESVSRKKTEIDQKLNQTASQFQASAEQKKENLSQKSSELASKWSSINNNQKTSIQSTVKDVLGSNVENLNQAKTTINTIVENIKQKNVESVTNSNAEVEQNVVQSIDKIQTTAQTLGPKVDELQQSMITDLEGIVETFKQSIDTTKLDVRAFNRAQADKYLGYSEETTRKTGEAIDGISESVTSSLSELNSSLDLVLDRKVEDLSLQVQEALSALNEKVNGIKESLKEELLQQKNVTISNAISQIKESMAHRYTDLQNNEQNQRNNMISERDIFSQKLEAHYNETLENYNQNINTINENTRTRLNAFTEGLATQFNELSTNTENNLNLHLQTFKDLSQQLNTTLSEELIIGSDRLKEKWTDLIEKTEALMQESETKINQHYQEVNNLIQTTKDSVFEELDNYLQQTLDTTVSVTNEILNVSKTEIDEGKQLLSGNLNNEIDESVKYFEDTARKFTDTANYLISATMKLKNDFRDLEATSKEIQLPPIQTTSIVGLDAVLDHMARIIGSTKSNVTILSPKHEYIPLEAVKGLQRANITLVTSLDEEINKDWIDNAASTAVDVNIEIRKLKGVDIPQFIGVERDQEEVLIATQDEATGEVVGILSQSTYFAKLASFVIISHHAKGNSTKIR